MQVPYLLSNNKRTIIMTVSSTSSSPRNNQKEDSVIDDVENPPSGIVEHTLSDHNNETNASKKGQGPEDGTLANDLKVQGTLRRTGCPLSTDWFKWEVLGRACFQLIFAFIMSVAYLPNAVPTSGTYLIGILVSTCVVVVPHAMFILGRSLCPRVGSCSSSTFFSYLIHLSSSFS